MLSFPGCGTKPQVATQKVEAAKMVGHVYIIQWPFKPPTIQYKYTHMHTRNISNNNNNNNKILLPSYTRSWSDKTLVGQE